MGNQPINPKQPRQQPGQTQHPGTQRPQTPGQQHPNQHTNPGDKTF